MKLVLPDTTLTYQTKGEDGRPDGGVITLRVPSKSQVQKVRRAHTTERWKHGNRIVDTDWDAASSELLDAIVTGWDGITDLAGKPLPCVREIKLALPARVVQELFDLALGGNWREQADAEGNAPASSPAI